jgi:hypothetical protein
MNEDLTAKEIQAISELLEAGITAIISAPDLLDPELAEDLPHLINGLKKMKLRVLNHLANQN